MNSSIRPNKPRSKVSKTMASFTRPRADPYENFYIAFSHGQIKISKKTLIYDAKKGDMKLQHQARKITFDNQILKLKFLRVKNHL